MFFSEGHNGVHLTRYTRVMNRNNRPRFVSYGRFNQGFVDVHRIRADINKHDFRPTQYKRIRGGNKGVARHDDFITRLDVQQQRGHLQ
ncbi:hypothetical protein D3C80_1845970 [compost metagenome]